MEYTLRQIADSIGGQVRGNEEVLIRSVAPINTAQDGDITFISNPKYANALDTTAASAVIVSPNTTKDGKNLLLAENPYLAFAKVVELVYGQKPRPGCGVHARAEVDPTATVGEDVNILPGVFVGEGASIGSGTDLYPGVYVGPSAIIGKDCRLLANVTVFDRCKLGDRVVLHSGTVIGSDGFGFARDGDSQFKIQQVGNVVLEDDVEIGANCAVDRAVLGSTTIGRGTKMDNLIQVGHNVVIGANCTIVAQVGVSGSTKIGSNTVIAGQVGIAGHIEIGDNVEIGAKSGVISNVRSGERVLGLPAAPFNTARRAYAIFYGLPDMRRELSRLRKELDELKRQQEEA